MIRGWCPTVHTPMPSGDGLLVRVKPFGGRLPAAAMVVLGHAAAACGNGVIELTGRGNLQVRGVRDTAAFAAAMVAAGLADADPAREARRNVIALPPHDDEWVAEAEGILAETPGLPPKFCVVVRGAEVFVDGVGAAANASGLRRLLECAGLPPTQRSPHGKGLPEGFPLPSRLPSPWDEEAGHLLHLPFGQTDATTLARLAMLTPELRTTPWRAFLSPIPVPGFEHPTTNAACPGGPACASGTTATRADALRLQEAGFTGLHVSGCAKGCAHPGAATTLVGRDGRYDLVRLGAAGDVPELRGLTLTEAMAAL